VPPEKLKIAFVLLGALVGAGCADVEIFETQAVVLAETDACQTAAMNGVRVNAYRLLLLELPVRQEGRLPCAPCVEGECNLVAVRCGCGSPVPTLTGPINQQLQGLRFPDLDPEASYCLGIVGFALEDLPPTSGTTAEPCACDFGDHPVTGRSRLCGITPLAARVGENASFVPVSAECRACPNFER
jgi:hypothetical protein